MGTQKEGGKATPLVDATIEFLKEFNPVEVDPKAKGKEVDRQEEDGLESFIPTHVYDAMKEKKRFDNMRVGFDSSRLWNIADLFLIHRADSRRMLKNSLDSIWTLSKRNYFRSPM